MSRSLNGLTLIIIGLVMIFRIAPQLELDSLTQIFLETHGQLAVLPPGYWALAARLVGGVLIFLGFCLVDLLALLDKIYQERLNKW